MVLKSLKLDVEDELLSIFIDLCKKEHYQLSNTCREILLDNFAKAKQKESFGNGRYVRNLFEKIKFEQADRVVKANSKAINTINKYDIQNAIKTISYDVKEKRKIGFCS